LGGIGVGFGLALDPVYISEISPAAHRGRLVTWSEIGTNVGIIFGFASGLVFSSLSSNEAWRYMIGVGAILPTVLIILVCFVMPESPRWLVAKNRDEDAVFVLSQIYPSGFDVESIVRNIRENLRKELESSNAIGWDAILFPTPALRRMLLVGLGTAVAQQAVGIDAIQYFLIFIIDETGIKNRSAQSCVLIFLGLLKLSFIFIASSLFDSSGRRPLMFISLGGMSFALLIQSINFIETPSASFAIFAFSIYLIFFSVGMGPGCWLIPSEVFPSSIRAKAMSIATFLNRCVGTVMISSFLSVAGSMTWSGFFFLLAMVCGAVIIFFYLFLPETKGRSLEDMNFYFAEITGDQSILDVQEPTTDDPTEDQEETMYTSQPDSSIIDDNLSIEASGILA